ncbi:MAG: rod shape-determining protein MreC [bacterium]|nr:rod shape-determining protein MreC [bacterium]
MIITIFLLESTGIINLSNTPLQRLFVPLQLSLYKTKQDFSNFVATLGDIRALRENENNLRAENVVLLAENARLKKLETENKALREQLGAKKTEKKLLVAEVIGGDPLAIKSKLLINKGSRDGVKKSDLVIIKDVLLGEIVSVGFSSATARLLSDPDTKIPAETASNVKGIVVGEFGNKIVFDKVVQGEKLKIGEIVFSSGEADFPKGLVLGKISKVKNYPAALFQRGSLEPLFPYGALETVFIIEN